MVTIYMNIMIAFGLSHTYKLVVPIFGTKLLILKHYRCFMKILLPKAFKDAAADLNGQVDRLQRSFLYNTVEGRPLKFVCYLTGVHLIF
jgi:hypothetical protein